jgi:hypothetical protein
MYKDLIQDKELYSLDFPKTIVPTPTDIDYENGFINRYFTQRVNDSNSFVFEINLEEYGLLLENPYWTLEEMRWRLTGPKSVVYSNNGSISDIGVIASNTASISIVSTKIKNIGLYLPNLLQFYKG